MNTVKVPARKKAKIIVNPKRKKGYYERKKTRKLEKAVIAANEPYSGF